jgi:hypothetical protein
MSRADVMDEVAKMESNRARIPLLERLLTCARARCSYVGCTRHRHTGPCNLHAQGIVEKRNIPAAAESGPRLSDREGKPRAA